MAANDSQLLPNEWLEPNQKLVNKNITLTYQADGDLVWRGDVAGAPSEFSLSQTKGRPAGVCIMQGDGNLVIYGPEPGREHIWDAATAWGFAPQPGSSFWLDGSGMYWVTGPDNQFVWRTQAPA